MTAEDGRLADERWSPDLCPTGKISYRSERSAKSSRNLRRNKGKKVRAYFCKECRGWHLTTQPRMDRK